MRVIRHRNVHGAFGHFGQLIRAAGVGEESRTGHVLVWPEPLTTIYNRPMERVLLDENRMANPFFHLFESIWMLTGRNDATFLNHYVHDFGSRFAERDGTLHGAYGYRWRSHFGVDQLLIAVELLKTDPSTRRCVIGMWSPNDDLAVDAKDVPCNTQIFLSLRNNKLDMMVSCRSNDAVWGAYGANVVHMSVLQEFLASQLGTEMGIYRQVSYNMHVYMSTLDKMPTGPILDPYAAAVFSASPIFPLGERQVLENLNLWMENTTLDRSASFIHATKNLLIPMARAYEEYKTGAKESRRKAAIRLLDDVTHEDWKAAATMWINRGIVR